MPLRPFAFALAAMVSMQNAPASPPAGGRVSGWTVTQKGTPIAGVEVGLPCPPQRVRYTKSDESGRFEFAALPDGDCRVVGRKDGYVEASYNGPGRGPYGMEVRGGKTFDGIELRMDEGATVAGTLRASGGPLPAGVRYQVIRRDVVNGIPTLMTLPYLPVRADGSFTSRPVPPGDYYLVAWPAPSNDSEPGAGFAVTYFPGTSRIADANLITLKAGERRDDLNFTLQKVPTFTVSGAVYDAAGKPVRDIEVGLSFDTPPKWTRGTARTAADGTFAIANIQNGSYVLRGARKTATRTWETGEVHFDVSDGDVAHLTLRLSAVR